MRRKICLYRHYVSIVVRGMMQYKASFLLNSLGQFLVSFSVFLGIYFMFRRFHQVRGYSYSEVLLCYAIVLMEFSLAEMWARGFDTFSGLVRSGEFDRVLVRPQGEILQVLGSKFRIDRIGLILQALVMFAYGIAVSPVAWTTGRVMTVLFMLVGGTILFISFFWLRAAFTFFTLEGIEAFNILTYGAKEHGKYPIDIYGKKMLQICTYIIPYTLIQYYPLQYLLGRTDRWYYGLYLFGVAGIVLVCCAVWSFGMRHYQSAGS